MPIKNMENQIGFCFGWTVFVTSVVLENSYSGMVVVVVGGGGGGGAGGF